MSKLKVIVFDVEHGFCSYVQCPNGYSLMVDCGGRPDFSPARYLKQNSNIYFPNNHNGYSLTKLVVTHPHGDHLEDVETLLNVLPPAILTRTPLSNFHPDDIKQRERERDDENLKIYRLKLDQRYSAPAQNLPNWGMSKHYFSLTPDEARNIDPHKVINNTSKILLVEFAGRKILFTGDLETMGWETLIKKNPNNFIEKVKGVDIFIAPHHGHKSAFSQSLFNIMGKPLINIISKESEKKDVSDVDSRYSQEGYAQGIVADDGSIRRSLTTRCDGSIFIDIEENGGICVQLEELEANQD